MSPFSVHQDPCSLKETLVQNLNEDLLLYDNGVVIAKLQETSGAWVYESVSSPPSIPILSSSSKGTKASGRRPHPTHPRAPGALAVVGKGPRILLQEGAISPLAGPGTNCSGSP